MKTQTCPICSAKVEVSSRYPRHVCSRCEAQATSRDGRLLRFSNVDPTGGFVARYADTGAEHPGHACYIQGVACYADEDRFGGIVIEVVA